MSMWIEIEHVDALPVKGATLDDLDLTRIQRHLDTGRVVRSRAPMEYLTE